MLRRFPIVVLLLSFAIIAHARGRTHGYQAGGGARHAQPKLKAKQNQKQKKSTLPATPGFTQAEIASQR